jgi:hypothetical protein
MVHPLRKFWHSKIAAVTRFLFAPASTKLLSNISPEIPLIWQSMTAIFPIEVIVIARYSYLYNT